MAFLLLHNYTDFILNFDIDEHKTFISDLNYSFKNKQLGKIDTFKIKQLIESLNKAG